MIPDFNWDAVIYETWQFDPWGTFQIILMGFFVAGSCGLIGSFVVLRRMALMGDAISHSLLPGIAIAYLITGTRDASAMFIGGVIAGLLTVLLVEAIHRNSRVKVDAAMGITFSTFFAVGVILITAFADHVDLDADCVLYGEIILVPFDAPVRWFGVPLGPESVVQMGSVFLGLLVLIMLFYKELLVTTFDVGLARSLGLSPQVFHYGTMGVLSLVIVSAFEAVGAILVIAMLILPPATALLLARRLSHVLVWTVVLSALYAIIGYHLDVWLNATMAGTMVVVALLIFCVVWMSTLVCRRWGQHAAMEAMESVETLT